MENLNRNLHLRLQEMCDCYMETDFMPELEKAATYRGSDLEENAIKYFALTILEAITQKAAKLKINRADKVKVKVVSLDEKIKLPSPSKEIADEIFKIIREITHLEGDKGESALAFGLQNGQLDLTVKLKTKEGKQSLKLTFPELEPH